MASDSDEPADWTFVQRRLFGLEYQSCIPLLPLPLSPNPHRPSLGALATSAPRDGEAASVHLSYITAAPYTTIAKSSSEMVASLPRTH